MRTQGRPEDIAAQSRIVATGIDTGLFPSVHLLSDSFHEEVGTVEKGAMIASLMGASAVFLAAVGLVGLVASAVSQKTQEIAIRLALGAKKITCDCRDAAAVCWADWVGIDHWRGVGSSGIADVAPHSLRGERA